MNLKLPAAREEPPYPILNILHRNGIVRRAFSNPNSETLDSPGLKRNFPAEMCSRCSKAVLGFQRRSLCALITGDALKADNDNFLYSLASTEWVSVGKTTDKGMEGVDKPHCPGLVPAWQRAPGSLMHPEVPGTSPAQEGCGVQEGYGECRRDVGVQEGYRGVQGAGGRGLQGG